MRIQSVNFLIPHNQYKTSSQKAPFTEPTICNPIYFTAYINRDRLTKCEKIQIETLIDNYSQDDENIQYIGKGTCGTVYKIKLPHRDKFAVKVLSENTIRTYSEGNLKKEAKILEQIPKSCNRTQQLVDYFQTDKREYLVSNFIEGKPLSQCKTLTQKQLDNITDEIFKYDTKGFMFYDLNGNNIFINGNDAGFIDFEFCNKKNPYKIDLSAFNDKHHIGRNLCFPQKSNINAFENRTLGVILQHLNKSEGDELIKTYLQSLSIYHGKMAKFHKNNSEASDYEKILSRLYKNPTSEIITIEKNIITLRSLTFNYHLYKIREKQGKLLKNDVRTYSNYNKFKEHITNIQKVIKEELKAIASASSSEDIHTYCKITELLTNYAMQ